MTGVEEAKKPLQDVIVQQEREIASLRKRMDTVVNRLEEYEETFDLVTKEFASMVMVLAERQGDEKTLKIMQEAKEKLGTITPKKKLGKVMIVTTKKKVQI